MPEEVVALVCGRVIGKTLRLPSIPFQIVPDIGNLRVIMLTYPVGTRFIVLYYDQLDQGSQEILCPLSCEENIDVIVLGGHSLNDLPRNQINRLRLSEDLIAYKTAVCGIQAYQSIAKRYYASGDQNLGGFFDDEARKLLSWLMNNLQLKACHILIIPLNTDYVNLMNCQLDLIEKCQAMWPNKEIRVCTIGDYHLTDESVNTDNVIGSFMRHDRDMMLTLIRHLAPIRLYLGGNEPTIGNYYSRLLVAKERYLSENKGNRYMDGCTFLEKELIGANIKENLPGFLGAQWQINGSQIKFMSVDELFIGRFIQNRVDCVDDTMSKRDNDARIAIWKRNIDYQDNTTDYSSELHTIDQAQGMLVDDDYEQIDRASLQ